MTPIRTTAYSPYDEGKEMGPKPSVACKYFLPGSDVDTSALMDDSAACGYIHRRKDAGNPSLMHSITVLLANCLNALVRKETPTVLVSGIIVLSV